MSTDLPALRQGPADVRSGAPIRFHRRLSDHYGAFANYSRHAVILEGQLWSTAEHFFQARKFPHDPGFVIRIQRAATPSRAAAMGRTRLVRLRPDWDTVRVDLMRTAMAAKFVQHPALKALLLSTGNRRLVEVTHRDSFWGTGPAGNGLNLTGQILEQIRARLSEATCPVDWFDDDCARAGRWVAFGNDVIVMPILWRAVPDLRVQALHCLTDAPSWPGSAAEVGGDRGPYRTVTVPGHGRVLLRTRPGARAVTELNRDDLAALLVSVAREPVTWVHDPRWPRTSS